MFKKRLLSGIVLVACAILLFYFGNIYLLTGMFLLSEVGVFELLRVFGLQKNPMGIVAYISTLAIYVLIYFNLYNWILCVVVFSLTIILMIYVLRYPKETIKEVSEVFLSIIYAGLILSFIYLTRNLENGRWLVWMIIIGSWGSDTCAYVVGVLIGKHHFSELSPKKTIEGCVGGIIGAALIAFGFSIFFPYQNMFILPKEIVFPIIALVCAVISQVGDLAASAIKRNHDIKDYGKLIPGHGGVMDRFDSVIFVAPFVYYLLLMVSNFKM